MVGDASLLPHVEKLLADADASVRREAVLVGGDARARAEPVHDRDRARPAPTSSRRSSPRRCSRHGRRSTAKRSREAADIPAGCRPRQRCALAAHEGGRCTAALLPLLGGDVAQRVAAVRASARSPSRRRHDPLPKLLPIRTPPSAARRSLRSGSSTADVTRKPSRSAMLSDADPTVREAAARVLTPVAIDRGARGDRGAARRRLRAAARSRAARALIRPATTPSQATIALAAEDARHAEPAPPRGRVVRPRPAAQRRGRSIGTSRCWRGTQPSDASRLAADRAGRRSRSASSATRGRRAADVAGQSRARSAPQVQLPQARRHVQRDGRTRWSRAGDCGIPRRCRSRFASCSSNPDLAPPTCAAAAFAIGVVSEPADAAGCRQLPRHLRQLLRGSTAKFEAIKALGNIRHAASIERLKKISQTDRTPDLRWLAHWSYQRAANAQRRLTRRRPSVASRPSPSPISPTQAVTVLVTHPHPIGLRKRVRRRSEPDNASDMRPRRRNFLCIIFRQSPPRNCERREDRQLRHGAVIVVAVRTGNVDGRIKRCASRDLAANSHVIAPQRPKKSALNAVFGVEALLSLLYFPAPRRWV